MKHVVATFCCAALLSLVACAPDPEPAEETPAVTTEAPTPAEPATPPEDPAAAAFAGPIERAHGKTAWDAAPAVAADVELTFGGNKVIDGGRMVFTPDMGKVSLDTGSGARVVWDGERAWVTPASSELQRARFQVLTWPYFLAAPMKLRDPGTTLEPTGPMDYEGTPHETARLTFGDGVGDSPEDWYLVYRDPETDLVSAMAYIVTYGGVGEEEPEAHAITYHDYQTVDGIAVPTRWVFREWNEEEGVHGEPRGEARLSSFEVTTPEPGLFDKPEDAREDELPAA
jgi:hypothetical protein